jgi:hypothetical protein
LPEGFPYWDVTGVEIVRNFVLPHAITWLELATNDPFR